MTFDSFDLGVFSRSRVRHVRQTEIAECGLACLTMLASYHGLHIDMAMLRRRFVPSTRGASLQSLMTIADRLGLTSRAVRVEMEDLDAVTLPAVLHWNMNHFVVLERISGTKALIHDPASTSRWVRKSEVSKFFTGVALEVEPSSEFETGDVRRPLRLSKLWSRTSGLKRAGAQIVLLSLVIQTFALVSPYYLQLAIDKALQELNIGLLGVLALGFGLLAIMNGIASLLRSSVLLAVGSLFGFGLSSNVARKLFRLPAAWFGRREIGDILSRFQSVLPIRRMLAEEAPKTVVDGVLAGLTFVLMLIYSQALAMIALTALAMDGMIKVVLFRLQRAAQQEMIIASGREQSLMIETIRGIRPLRLAGRETLRHAIWQSRLTEAVNGNARSQRLTNWQNTLQTTLFSLENIISVWLAVVMVARGGFSVGMVFAFLAFKVQFLTAASSLISKAFEFKMLGLHLARLSDIALASEDISFTSERDGGTILRGQIVLQDVFYRYSDDDPFVLSGVSFALDAGESVAITGPSGGGKSTLVQILLGLAKPTSGNIIIDGVMLADFGYRSYHMQVAAVLQDDVLFSGSLGENISLFDENADMLFVRECAQAAAISDDIEAMPMRYETLVGEMGFTLSGGQRQRLLLARALYRRPRILIMDEGTSSLDQMLERQINRAVAAMGITRIIVAHRKETIESAERILYLDNGVITEPARS